MAGGIEWFRWHHGSVCDPKFGLVAKKAGATVAEVIAIWASLLEAASASATRGDPGNVDFESMGFSLGIDEDRVKQVHRYMKERGLVDAESGRIAAWEKRQPKREREDDSAAERKRRQRERDAGGVTARITPTGATPNHVTPSHASGSQETPRGEESREEENCVSVASQPRRRRKAADTPGHAPSCPQEQIVALYHEKLPTLPKAKLMPASRQRALRKVWGWVLSSKKPGGERRATNAGEALTWFGDYFERAAANDFLMGRGGRSAEHANWQCDLDFLLTDKGMKHVIEKTEAAA
jgi:hypothetical protein